MVGAEPYLFSRVSPLLQPTHRVKASHTAKAMKHEMKKPPRAVRADSSGSPLVMAAMAGRTPIDRAEPITSIGPNTQGSTCHQPV